MWWDKPIPIKKVKCIRCGHVWETQTKRRVYIIDRCPKCCDEHTICRHDVLRKDGRKWKEKEDE